MLGRSLYQDLGCEQGRFGWCGGKERRLDLLSIPNSIENPDDVVVRWPKAQPAFSQVKGLIDAIEDAQKRSSF